MPTAGFSELLSMVFTEALRVHVNLPLGCDDGALFAKKICHSAIISRPGAVRRTVSTLAALDPTTGILFLLLF